MAIKVLFLGLVALLLLGCSDRRGLLYTSLVEPYSGDFRETPVGTKSVVTTTHRFKVFRLNLSGEWDTDEIVRVAREAGITDIHYIDVKTFSILLGTYRRQTLIVYGD
jgi:TRL-like protein family